MWRRSGSKGKSWRAGLAIGQVDRLDIDWDVTADGNVFGGRRHGGQRYQDSRAEKGPNVHMLQFPYAMDRNGLFAFMAVPT
jgi:hypothetical protein